MPNYFLQLSEDSAYYSQVNKAITKFGRIYSDKLLFCIDGPLGYDNHYGYDGFIILSPNHKITIVGSADDDKLEDFVSDILDDISSISKTHNYQEYIGRPRVWKDRIIDIKIVNPNEEFEFNNYVGDEINLVANGDKRLLKYIISLLTGSINELNANSLIPATNLLDEIKQKITLFDADQTKFLYNNYNVKRFVSVFGLSGTGKTELLLHKLSEIYDSEEDSRIFFTCHNIALANELRGRIPEFFNKMKVTRQIEWDQKLWVSHAWGSRAKPNSGLYTYLCNRYNIPFKKFCPGITYDTIFTEVLSFLNKIPKKEFKPCFDYMLIDESQDFPDVFFDVCKKITKTRIYTAGDVFQNIFYQNQSKPKGFDISLNRCYRTDPRTLMYAHTLGLGLKERQRYNWFDKKEWETFGYKPEYNKLHNSVTLKREPITRFEGQEPEQSVQISCGTTITNIQTILQNLRERFPNIHPGDVAIIMIDDDKEIYGYMDKLAYMIQNNIGWNVLRGHEEKHTDINKLYLTNTNNVKGLEFPFVICITAKIENEPHYRNKLYTMLTRSFLITYLVIRDTARIQEFKDIYNEISSNREIKDIRIPDEREKAEIQHALITKNEERAESWDEFMSRICASLNITSPTEIARYKHVIVTLGIEMFDEVKIRECIETNRRFL